MYVLSLITELSTYLHKTTEHIGLMFIIRDVHFYPTWDGKMSICFWAE